MVGIAIDKGYIETVEARKGGSDQVRLVRGDWGSNAS